MLDRVERTDVVNAVALAAALLACGYLLLAMFGWLSSSLDGGLVTAEGGEEDEVVAEDLLLDPNLRPPNEVSVRVGNGSEGRQGLAGRATRKLDSAGYGTLEPVNKEGGPVDDSLVYYIDGFQLDAVQVATALNIAESQVRPLLDNPGIETEGADIIVILGQTAEP